MLQEAGSESDRIRQAYLRFYARPPTGKELEAAEGFIKQYAQALAKDKVAAGRQQRETWAAFCQALFAGAEFLYVN